MAADLRDVPSPLTRLTAYKFLWGLSFAAPVQTLFLLGRGLSFAQIMVLESVLSAAIMLGEVPTGIVSDRYGRKLSLLCGAALSLLAWLPFLLADSFALFAVSFALAGIAFCFGSGSDQALIYDQLAAEDRSWAMSRVFGRYGAAALAAGGLAGIAGGVLATRGYELLYGLTIVSQLAAVAVLLTVPEPRRGAPAQHRPRAWRQIRGALRLLRTEAELRHVTLLSVFTAPLTVVLAYGWQPYLQSARVPDALFGVALGLASAASVLANLVAHRLEARLGVRRAMTVAILAPALLWAAMAATTHPALALGGYVLTQGTAALRGPVFASATNPLIPSRMRATVLSAISLLSALWMLLIRPVLGALVDVDLSLGFAACAVSIMAGWGMCRVAERCSGARRTSTGRVSRSTRPRTPLATATEPAFSG